MTMVTVTVSSQEQVTRRALAAFSGEPQGAHISFQSAELLWQTLGAKRWDLLKRMTGRGPMSIREAARQAGRDVKAVHADIHALLNAGLLERGDDGLIVFPYESIHVDFMLSAA
jgi:predicted transcriptional regulator